jgi:hypothetical protein
MNGSDRQNRGTELPSQRPGKVAIAPMVRVVSDIPTPLPVTDPELDLIARHLGALLQRALSDEGAEDSGGGSSRGSLRAGLDVAPS